MFKIGDFSKLSRVPVKTLRYYDEIGLFKPHGIDRFTRYRYYSVDQLAELYRILGLKELGFSLEQIAQLLAGDLSPEQIRKMLELRRVEIEQQIDSAQSQLAQVEARLQQLEQEGRLPHYEVVIKTLKAQWVAVIDERIPGYEQAGPVFEHLFVELYGYLESHAVEPGGPGFVLYYEPDPVEECTRIEAAIPVHKALPGSQRVRIYRLPRIEQAACVVHPGSLATIGDAYRFLVSWVQANGYRISGPVRECRLRHPQDGDKDHYVTEIQFPVREIREGKIAMEAKIVQLDKFLVVGMAYLGKNENNEIAQIWEEFVPRIPEIKHLAENADVSYGVCSEDNPQKLIDYVAALPVTKLADIPEGMVGREVPTQTYVVLPAHGVEDIGPTYNRILTEWLPTSGYKPGRGPDFELYPESFDPNDPESLIYIYFPIEK